VIPTGGSEASDSNLYETGNAREWDERLRDMNANGTCTKFAACSYSKDTGFEPRKHELSGWYRFHHGYSYSRVINFKGCDMHISLWQETVISPGH
jgi:hypothetical protein